MRRSESKLFLLRRFASDTSGVSAVEYALLLAGISIAILAAVNSIGQNVFGFYSKISNGVSAQN